MTYWQTCSITTKADLVILLRDIKENSTKLSLWEGQCLTPSPEAMSWKGVSYKDSNNASDILKEC